jgi:hypothetical protein
MGIVLMMKPVRLPRVFLYSARRPRPDAYEED